MNREIVMSNRNLKKISFLRKILENKDILFGKFSGSLTQNDKQKKWEEIREFAVSIGLITNDKNYTFVRNNTWGNIRKATMVSGQ